MVAALQKRFLIIISLFAMMFLLVFIQNSSDYKVKIYRNFIPHDINSNSDKLIIKAAFLDNSEGKWRGLSDTQLNKLSRLGKILYLNYRRPEIRTTKNYTILIWKHGKSLENRHIKHYSNQRFEPFENCSVKNCKITYEDQDLPLADLVLFHLHRTKNNKELPKGARNPNQIWTFLTDESPFNTFLYSQNNSMKNYNGVFNWSMMYRMDADIPVPYGRTVALEEGEDETEETLEEWNKSKNQNVLVAIMGSNCGGRNHRWNYVKELEKHMAIDKYGGCGTLKCPGHFTKDCPVISKYKFYLSFENSNCDEYVTEKLWWNGYDKNTIPIVMGTSKRLYQQLLPPNSYIHVDDFATPRDLANYIIYLNSTPGELQNYHQWKKYFKVLNEHGYFQSSSIHYCRICEALNYNEKKSKTYQNLSEFWSRTNDCHQSWDAR